MLWGYVSPDHEFGSQASQGFSQTCWIKDGLRYGWVGRRSINTVCESWGKTTKFLTFKIWFSSTIILFEGNLWNLRVLIVVF